MCLTLKKIENVLEPLKLDLNFKKPSSMFFFHKSSLAIWIDSFTLIFRVCFTENLFPIFLDSLSMCSISPSFFGFSFSWSRSSRFFLSPSPWRSPLSWRFSWGSMTQNLDRLQFLNWGFFSLDLTFLIVADFLKKLLIVYSSYLLSWPSFCWFWYCRVYCLVPILLCVFCFVSICLCYFDCDVD